MKRQTNFERRERDTRSVGAIRDLLKEVVAKPGPFLQEIELRKALSSQGALAKHEDSSRGIVRMSLNTQKLVAEKEFGYDVLDRLRRNAHDALAREGDKSLRSNKTTKIGLYRRVEELEQEVRLLDTDLVQLTHALSRLISVGRSLAEATGEADVVARWRKELRSIEAGLSLRKRVIPSAKVVPISAARPSQ